jgi:ATP-dependent DNA helicase PIF1
MTTTTFSLSEEQHTALKKFQQGHNLFLTGPAGTGKSFLIDQMVHWAALHNKRIQVTAMTGVAAVLLGKRARTLHSWSGIRLAEDEPTVTAKRVDKNPKSRKSWQFTDILVVDEVSMMSKHVFDTLKTTAELVRRSTQPFGNMQLVFVGDMFQLPPVGKHELVCFQSEHWESVFPFPNHIELRTIFRQSDPLYASVLNQIREGHIDETSVKLLQGRCIPPPQHVILTRFFPKRSDVDQFNQREFAKLATQPTETYLIMKCTTMRHYIDTGEWIVAPCKKSSKELSRECDAWLKQTQLESVILRVGAVVMCTANLDMSRGIVNGSQGVVVDFVHMPYSVPFFDAPPPPSNRLPVVEFLNGVRIPVPPRVWQSGAEPAVAVAQIPLTLSWAMTIHKAQGATLDSAWMDVGDDIFEYGQAYVALSRVKTLDGLYLSHFNPTKIRANPIVQQFYSTIRSNPPSVICNENTQSCDDDDTNVKRVFLTPSNYFS